MRYPAPSMSSAPLPADPAPGRARMLALLSVAVLLGMSLWFAPNAASPQLVERWDLDPSRVGWLIGAMQLGFVAGTACAALLNLADLWPSRGYFAVCALLAAAANLALLAAPGYVAGLTTRFLTGFFLAGVYPPGMKMVATWFRRDRGLAIGILVGALGAGSAIPFLVHAFGMPDVSFVITTTSGGAVLGALLVALFYRDGPFPFTRRPFDFGLVSTIARDRETRLVTFGYLGHMWELYAMWTWVPAFALASAGTSGPPWLRDMVAFGMFVCGGLGCVWGGWAARRIGSRAVVTISMAVSGACCLAAGLFFGGPSWLVAVFMGLWGFFVVSDSAQFSAMVTEAAPQHAVGTALTLQVSLGFLLTLGTIQLVPALVGVVGWRWGFAALALGPALGIAGIARLGAAVSAPRS